MNIKLLKGVLVLLVLSSIATANPSSGAAMEFIKSKQLANGAFDLFSSPQSPAAVLALYSMENSSNLTAGAAYLKSDLENPASYSWGEADIPGFELYAYLRAGNSSGINLTDVTGRLFGLRGQNGGFKGYSHCVANCSDPDWQNQVWTAVEDAISTSAVLMGLVSANSMNDSWKNETAQYLQSLRNLDGSYNLTRDLELGSLWSLAPDIYAQTAFVVWGLEIAGQPKSNVATSLAFLQNGAQNNFSNANRTYAAAVTSIVLAAYNHTNGSIKALDNLQCAQREDGGFRDSGRFGGDSNVLDTAFAILAIGNHTFVTNCTDNSTASNSTDFNSTTPAPTPTPSSSSPPSQSGGSSYSGGGWIPPTNQTNITTPANQTNATTPKPSETVKNQSLVTIPAANPPSIIENKSVVTGSFFEGNTDLVLGVIALLVLVGAFIVLKKVF